MPEATTASKLSPGARILIADQYTEAAGGGSGEYRAARTVRKTGTLRVPGEPTGVHAATVIRVDRSAVLGRYDVVTNLGTVLAVTAGQPFRPAPADMRDSADLRAEMLAYREDREAKEAYDRANPRDVDGVNVHPGDLVELLDAGGGGRSGQPYTIVRAISAYPVIGGLLVARPYERGSASRSAGTGLALLFRRIADQDATGTALRSCGCPTVIRDEILPAPADGDRAAWAAAIRDMNRIGRENHEHRSECPWHGLCYFTAAGPRPFTTIRFLNDNDDTDDAAPIITAHAATGVRCGHGPNYEGSPVDVRQLDPESLAWYRFPPSLFPDRETLPVIRLASCLDGVEMLPGLAPAVQPLAEPERLLGGGGSTYGMEPLPAVPLDPADVQIVRHRASVTQGEVSVSYRGELLGRYGDNVTICTTGSNSREPHPHPDGASCFGGFHGHGDAYWLDAAARTVATRAAATPVDLVADPWGAVLFGGGQ